MINRLSQCQYDHVSVLQPNLHRCSPPLERTAIQVIFKAYIPGVFFVLRWQLSPTQMKCTWNANDSTYSPLWTFKNKGHSGFCIMIVQTQTMLKALVICSNATKRSLVEYRLKDHCKSNIIYLNMALHVYVVV